MESIKLELVKNAKSIYHLEALFNMMLVEASLRPSYLVESIDGFYAVDTNKDPYEAEKNKEITNFYMKYFENTLRYWDFESKTQESGFLRFIVRKDCDVNKLMEPLLTNRIITHDILGYMKDIEDNNLPRVGVEIFASRPHIKNLEMFGQSLVEKDETVLLYAFNTNCENQYIHRYLNKKIKEFDSVLEKFGYKCFALIS